MMWALINKENYVVKPIIGVSYDEALLQCVDGMYLVEMTLENTPAYVGSYYDGKTFSVIETDTNFPKLSM
jgi:hypothetical protein